jgi:hypothetical protein
MKLRVRAEQAQGNRDFARFSHNAMADNLMTREGREKVNGTRDTARLNKPRVRRLDN